MKQSRLISVLIILSFLFSTLVLIPYGNFLTANGQSSNDWSTYRHDLNHTGFSTSLAPATNNTLWTFQAGPFQYASPAVVNGAVYFACNDQHIYAVNESTGTKIWSFTTQANPGESSPAYANGIIYVGSYDCRLYALNASTGKHIWNYTTGDNVISSPAVANGKVFVGSWDKKVYALDAATGGLVWSYTTDGIVMSSPAVVDGMVFIGSGDGKVYAFNADTGAIIWNYATGSGVFSSPSVVDGKVYVGSNDGYCYALTETTGQQVWNQTTGSAGLSSPAVAYGNVYIGSNNFNVSALNAVTGAKIWNYTTGGYVSSAPAVADNTVFIGSYDGIFYALNAATGTKIWTYKSGSGGQFDSSPTVVDGKVFIGSPGGVLIAFGPSVGSAPTVTVTPVSWTMDVGQSKLFTANPTGGSGSYTSYQWYVGGTLQGGATSSTFNYVPVSAGSPSITATVTDSLGATSIQSSAVTVTVNSNPTASVLPYSWVMDMGQYKTFTANTGGGSLPYSYSWSVDYGAQSGTGSSFVFTPSAVNSHTVSVTVTDNVGGVVGSYATVTVNPALVAPTASASAGIVDQGQTSTLSITGLSGGTPPYSYQWLQEAPGAGSYSAISGATLSTYPFATSVATSTGSWSFEVQVTDNASLAVTVTSNAVPVTVNAALTVSVGSVSMDVSQSRTLTASASGGSGTLSYQWYLGGSPVSGQTGATYVFTASSTTSPTIYCRVLDQASTPVTVQSNTPSVAVNPALVAPTVTPSSGSVDQGQTSTLSIPAVTTGTSPYSYQWFSEAPGATTFSSINGAALSSYNFAPSTSTTPGIYNFLIQVTDNAGAGINSTFTPITVTVPAPTPTPAPTSAPTATPNAAPTHNPTPTARPTSSPTPSPTASPTPTASPGETHSTDSASWMNETMIAAIIVVVVVILLLILFLFARRSGKKKIVASAGPNGTITPSGTVKVKSGNDQNFNVEANAKFHISDIRVDDKSVGAKSSYIFTNVKDDHTISATFEPD